MPIFECPDWRYPDLGYSDQEPSKDFIFKISRAPLSIWSAMVLQMAFYRGAHMFWAVQKLIY